MREIKPICIGCNKYPNDLADFDEWGLEGYESADDMCREEEGAYNPSNGHFLCTPCYIEAGMPANPYPQPGWIAP